MSGCAAPASPETDPAGSPPVLGPSDPVSLQRGRFKWSHDSLVSIERVWRDVRTLTWLKQHDGLEAGELGGVDGEGLEAAEDLLQEAQVQAGVAALGLDAGAEVGQGQQRTAVQRQGPLDGAEQEELAPRLLQQDHLVGHGAAFQTRFPPPLLLGNGTSGSLLLTWSLKGRLENTGRFLAHFTDMKSSLAEVS